jgi:hypothetical protein
VRAVGYKGVPGRTGDEYWWHREKALHRWRLVEAIERGMPVPKLPDTTDLTPYLGALEVTFLSRMNVPDFAKRNGYGTSARPYFCDRPDLDETVAAYGVYWYNWQAVVRPDEGFFLDPTGPVAPVRAPDGRYVYRLFFYAQGDEYGPGHHPSHSFNLRAEPHDICFYVAGGAFGVGHRSNVVKVPKAAIAAALRDLPPVPPLPAK